MDLYFLGWPKEDDFVTIDYEYDSPDRIISSNEIIEAVKNANYLALYQKEYILRDLGLSDLFDVFSDS